MLSTTFLSSSIAIFWSFSIAGAVSSYANDFVNPAYILSSNFSTTTSGAQSTIMSWATQLAAQGPWSVMNKSMVPPSGDKHDYMSWAPYWWPNCTDVGNTTALTEEQIWTTCPYYQRDGIFNPDLNLLNNSADFDTLADAVLYNSISWALEGKPSSVYSQSVASFITTWFLDADTAMNPNLNYGQMQRGPTGQVGAHTGILDLKCMTKIVSGILILRNGGSTDWTTDLDTRMIAWTNEYIPWLETTKIALEEAFSANNHGSFYYNQLASLKLLVNDLTGAKNVTQTYFSTIYLNQIDANGEQPLEAVRTRPYHYRCYNLAAMITNARLMQYADPAAQPWNITTASGATIKTALDYTMTLSPSASNEESAVDELLNPMAAVATVYGDINAKYSSFLAITEPGYADEAFFLWDQPLAGGSNVSAGSKAAAAAPAADSAGVRIVGHTSAIWLAIVLTSVIPIFV